MLPSWPLFIDGIRGPFCSGGHIGCTKGACIDEMGRMTRQVACRDTRGSEKSDEFTPGARSTQIFPHRRRAHKCQKWR